MASSPREFSAVVFPSCAKCEVHSSGPSGMGRSRVSPAGRCPCQAGGGVRSRQGGGSGLGVEQHSSPRGTGAAWRSTEEGRRGPLKRGEAHPRKRMSSPGGRRGLRDPGGKSPGATSARSLAPGAPGQGGLRELPPGAVGVEGPERGRRQMRTRESRGEVGLDST